MNYPIPKVYGKAYLDIHPTVIFGNNVTLRNFLYIGKNCKIGSNVKLANSCNIDDGTEIGDYTNFQVAVQTTMNSKIGKECFFGAMVCLADEKFPAVGKQIRKSVIIGNNVIIGTRTTIVACNIGDNAVIGAHSMLMNDVPSGEVWAGVPAKPIMKNGKVMTREDYDQKKSIWEADWLESGNTWR